MHPDKKFKFVIITGLSGAGKTHAIRALEDLGFFCVDNLPPTLLPKFIELSLESTDRIEKVAIVIDIRGGDFFNDLFKALEDLKEQGISYEILFLEASTEVLVKRYKETRRRHPLSQKGRLLEDILLERKRLEEVRGIANKIIDTSELKISEFKDQINGLYGPTNDKVRLNIIVMSFGYKYGIPLDSDLVIDVRFLPNPFYQERLKEQTGIDVEVKDYVLKSPVTGDFLLKFNELLTFLLPNYVREGKTHLVIAIGCTGGQHRSVTLSEELGRCLGEKGYNVGVRHRDVQKKGAGGEPA